MTTELKNLWAEQLVILDLQGTERDSLLEEIAVKCTEVLPYLQANTFFRALKEREVAGSTAVGGGVAFPHVRLPEAPQMALVLGVSRGGVAFGAPDKSLTHLFFVLLAPPKGDYLRVLARLAKIFRDPTVSERLRSLQTPSELVTFLQEIS